MMSWATLVVRVLGMGVVLSLVLTRLQTAEIALWLFLATIGGLLLVVDMGFASTFARVIAYAMGGARSVRDFRVPDRRPGPAAPNWEMVSRIVGTMRTIYMGLALGWVGLISLGGTWFAVAIINELPSAVTGWTAWGMVIALSGVRFYGVQFSSRLLGYNRVALLRRWEGISLLLATVGNVTAMILGWGLVGLVAVTHGSLVLNTLVNRRLAIREERAAAANIGAASFDSAVFRDIWPPVWRSGVGIAMSSGVIQLTGVIYARVASAEAVASYLLALMVIRYLVQFSQAPFYTKLPILARLQAENRIAEQKGLAERGMRLAYWALAGGCVSVALLIEPAFAFLRPNADFVPMTLWASMALATFVSRYGAMHLQLYSITNHIVWHVANGVTGTIYLLLVLATYSQIGVYTFPLSQLSSDLLFYTWYSAMHSYRILEPTFWEFERRTSLIPFLFLVTGMAAASLL